MKINILLCSIIGFLAIVGQNPLLGQTQAENIFVKKMIRTTESEVRILHGNEGNIYVTGWPQDSIHIEIRVSSGHDSSSDEVINAVQPHIGLTRQQIIVDVIFKNESQGWFTSWFNENVYNGKKAGIQIDYYLLIPQDLSLDIQSEFGDVVIEDWNGSLKINQEHGHLNIDGPFQQLSGSLKFVDANFNKITNAQVDLKQVNFNAVNISTANIHSVGGILGVDYLDQLNLTSARDEIRIKHSNICDIKSHFSRIEIDKIARKSQFELLFGSLDIYGFTSTIPPMVIDQRSSNISIFVGEKGFEFRGELDGGRLRLPLSTQIISSVDMGANQKRVHAKYGTGKSEVVSLQSKNGDVIFRNQ